jgi:hypothetical protein
MEKVLGKAEKRYRQLEVYRNPYLDRARECAKYTIPALLPPEGDHSYTALPTPYQTIGAEGVNNLASKTLLSLFPTSASFLRFMLPVQTEEKARKLNPELMKAIEEGLAKAERAVMRDIEVSGDRPIIFECLKHLFVTGNGLLYDSPEGLRFFQLDKYVVKRDPVGEPLEIIISEKVAPSALTEEERAKIFEGAPDSVAEEVRDPLYNGELDKGDDQALLNVYTYIWREGNKYKSYQECFGRIIPNSEGDWLIEECPYIPLRLIRVTGEDYGRSYVEEYLGSLISLEELYKALLDASHAMARFVLLINPMGTTNLDDVVSAENGDALYGNPDDVHVLQTEKSRDMMFVETAVSRLERQLSRVFLLHTAIQRDAERVTAEEIRFLAEELENALGGMYSNLSAELQLPYVRAKIAKLKATKKIPKLPQNVEPVVITGIEALGRGAERNKIAMFLRSITEVFGPQITASYIKPAQAIHKFAISFGLEDPDSYIKSEEELMQEQQTAQLQQLIEKLGPNAMQMIQQTISQQPAQETQQGGEE